MEVTKNFNAPQPASREGFSGDIAGEVIELNPPHAVEGFLEITPEPPRNLVVDQRYVETERSKYGTSRVEIFTFENGRQHEVIVSQPKRQRSDFPVVMTTALGTSTRGHNWHTMHKAMELGYPVVSIGPEGANLPLPKTPRAVRHFLRHLASIDLAETALNMHEALEVTDESGLYTPGEIVSTGESRAAGAALGLIALSHYYDRKTLYADLLAPPFPKSINTLREGVDLLTTVTGQTSLLGNLPLKIHPKRLLKYPETLDLHPAYVLHMLATIPALWTGKAGRFADNLPNDIRLHTTLFEDDVWCSADGWQEKFDQYEYAHSDRRPGNHMAIAREGTQRRRIVRLRNLRDELESTSQQPDKVNWHNVYLGGLATAYTSRQAAA